MQIEYSNWPEKKSLRTHLTEFQPFISRQVNSIKFQVSDLLRCNDIVDISCLPELEQSSEEFRGSVKDRDLLYLELCKFASAFIARQSGEPHWLDKCNLKLFLSQQVLFSIDEGMRVPKSLGS